MYPCRPFLVGFVCWMLILGGAFGGYRSMMQLNSDGLRTALAAHPYPVWMAGTILYGTLAGMVICGICLYERLGWMRFVYLPSMLPWFVQRHLDLDHAGVSVWAGRIWDAEVVLYLASGVILFLPSARRFFHPPQYIDG